MYRLNGFVRPIRSRFLSTSQNFQSTKLNHGGIPQNKIPHWEDENVNIGFMSGRSDVRAQRFKKQTMKNAATRRTRVQIVDNSKWGTAQMHEEPEFVISYRKQRRFHNGAVGDLCLITVDGEFKRALYVGQTKPNETFKAFYDTNMVVIIDDEGAPAGTRILAPLPSWLRDPKVHAKFEAYKFQDVQMNKILAICPRFV